MSSSPSIETNCGTTFTYANSTSHSSANNRKMKSLHSLQSSLPFFDHSTGTRQPRKSVRCTASITMPITLCVLYFVIRPIESIPCYEARLKCAYRTGCGLSLQSYMVECAGLIAGQTDRCTTRCENALISLVSSDEGGDLMQCDCEGSPHCERSKQRIEVCRAAVSSATAKDSIVSCTTARWICLADSMCRTALEYYNIYCRGLFHGNKCSYRCKNSLSILERQEKAAKLRTCYCDGSEDFPCKRVKYNTERYCYSRIPAHPLHGGDDDHDAQEGGNSIEPIDSTTNNQYHRHGKPRHKQRIRGGTGEGGGAGKSSSNSIASPLFTLMWLLLIQTTIVFALNRQQRL